MQTNRKVLFMIEMALFSAIAVVLDLFSFSAWGQGGSISLQMVPIFMMSFRWGWKGGVATGWVFGLLQLIMGAYIIHPFQALLDYPLAFTAVGCSALTANLIRKAVEQKSQTKAVVYITLGCLTGSFLRLVFHNLSAMIYFGASAPADQPVWLYATIYNVSYILPSFILSVLLLLILVQARNSIFYKK
ncbi:energy-coupled thiamine transporter ThiT [Enterococcus olivae]